VLKETLVLAHPIIPFVTEELWEHVGGTGLLAEHVLAPEDGGAIRDGEAEAEIARVIDAIQQVRGWRDEQRVKPGAVLAARFDDLDGLTPLIARLARLTDAQGDPRPSVGGVKIAGGGLIELLEGADPAEAAARMDKIRKDLTAEIKRAEGKLNNEGFVAKAPEAVVAAERAKLDQLRAELEGLG
jgi:valyl-tRNA synthetase